MCMMIDYSKTSSHSSFLLIARFLSLSLSPISLSISLIINGEGREKNRRKNFYASSYSSFNLKLDGNQGSESIVYFPPLFPTFSGVRTKLCVAKEDNPDVTLDPMASKKERMI